MDAIKKQARIAGILYTLVAITGPFSLVYIPGKLFVAGGAADPGERIRASASLLRLGIASELVYQTIEVFLVLALYSLFKPVNKTLARQMAILGFIPIPIVFLNVLNEVASLMLVSGASFLAPLGKQQLGSLATLFAILHGQGLQVAGVFWGLWLFPFGLLIIRCGFIPKVLGVSVMIAGVGYLIGSFSSLALPVTWGALGRAAGMLEIGEPPIILWLLIWGARIRPTNGYPASVAQ
jgi:hypothetical protein